MRRSRPNLPEASVLFSANRYVSNGRVADITHIVYVDPDRYGELAEHADLVAVGEAVGKLNKLLPRRQFILMGPGRWGSRGDIKLGVRVTYSDINNTAMLIEIARKKGNYVPDLSFGTHFFQDLVESGIRYLPLYPDDEGAKFNERFLLEATNSLAGHCPECAGARRRPPGRQHPRGDRRQSPARAHERRPGARRRLLRPARGGGEDRLRGRLVRRARG